MGSQLPKYLSKHPKIFRIPNYIQPSYFDTQGPVVQNFVRLNLSLSPQFVNYISTLKANTLLYLLKKCENRLHYTHFLLKEK